MKRKIMAVTLTAAMLAGLAAVPVWQMTQVPMKVKF